MASGSQFNKPFRNPTIQSLKDSFLAEQKLVSYLLPDGWVCFIKNHITRIICSAMEYKNSNDIRPSSRREIVIPHSLPPNRVPKSSTCTASLLTSHVCQKLCICCAFAVGRHPWASTTLDVLSTSQKQNLLKTLCLSSSLQNPLRMGSQKFDPLGTVPRRPMNLLKMCGPS